MTLLHNVLGDGSVGSSVLQIGWQQYSAQKTSESTMMIATTKKGEKKEEARTDAPIVIITDVNIISDRLQQAQILEQECKIFAAAALLEGIDPKHFQPVHHDIRKEAKLFRQLLQESASKIIANNNKSNNKHDNHLDDDDDDEWIKQGEQHDGRHDFAMYYKVSPTNQITCRLETPIEPSLLVPILAVLNESELYQTWIPQYKVPRMEVVKSEKLCQSGRVSQTILVETEVPWPIAKRELILKAVACDDISVDSSDDNNKDDSDNNNNSNNNNNNNNNGGSSSRILVRIQSLDCEDDGEDGLEILPAKKGVRIKVDGGFVFEKCPMNHPMMAKKQVATTSSSIDHHDNNNNNLILLTFTFSVDPKLSILPQSFLNFFLRTAMRQIWLMFLHVAEEVGDGKRPAHSEAIERKAELYDWVEDRTNAMLQQSLSK